MSYRSEKFLSLLGKNLDDLNENELKMGGTEENLCVKAFPKDPTLIESIVQGEKKSFNFDRV